MKPYYFDSDETRTRLLQEAARWMGTPFHAKASVVGAGVDCVHLAAALYIGAGFMQTFHPPAYTMDGGQHDDSSKVIDYVEATGRFEKVHGAGLRLGDLLCFRLGKVAFHTGIKLEGGLFLQVMTRHPVACFTLADSTWSKRLTAVYRPLL